MNIKSHLIKGKVDMLLVDLPEEFVPKLVKYPIGGLWVVDSAAKTLNANKFKLPPGDWELIGDPYKVTEEVAEGLVEYDTFLKTYYIRIDTVPSFFGSANAALHSLIESEICLRNPMGDDNEFDKYVFNHSESHFKAWREAEAKVFHSPILLIKK